MPHFGLMDEGNMTREDAALMRSKLHWRCGRRRLYERKTRSALATLYDALLSAMRWRILTTDLRRGLGPEQDEALENERIVLSILRKAGILDGTFDLPGFEELVDQALVSEKEMELDYEATIGPLEKIMTRLGVLPFDEAELPPERPGTY